MGEHYKFFDKRTLTRDQTGTLSNRVLSWWWQLEKSSRAGIRVVAFWHTRRLVMTRSIPAIAALRFKVRLHADCLGLTEDFCSVCEQPKVGLKAQIFAENAKLWTHGDHAITLRSSSTMNIARCYTIPRSKFPKAWLSFTSCRTLVRRKFDFINVQTFRQAIILNHRYQVMQPVQQFVLQVRKSSHSQYWSQNDVTVSVVSRNFEKRCAIELGMRSSLSCQLSWTSSGENNMYTRHHFHQDSLAKDELRSHFTSTQPHHGSVQRLRRHQTKRSFKKLQQSGRDAAEQTWTFLQPPQQLRSQNWRRRLRFLFHLQNRRASAAGRSSSGKFRFCSVVGARFETSSDRGRSPTSERMPNGPGTRLVRCVEAEHDRRSFSPTRQSACLLLLATRKNSLFLWAGFERLTKKKLIDLELKLKLLLLLSFSLKTLQCWWNELIKLLFFCSFDSKFFFELSGTCSSSLTSWQNFESFSSK